MSEAAKTIAPTQPLGKSTLSSKGQVTLPKEVRERLGLKPSDMVVFTEDEQGRVVLTTALRQLDELHGMLKHLAKDRPVSIEEMDEAIGEAILERHNRSRQP